MLWRKYKNILYEKFHVTEQNGARATGCHERRVRKKEKLRMFQHTQYKVRKTDLESLNGVLKLHEILF